MSEMEVAKKKRKKEKKEIKVTRNSSEGSGANKNQVAKRTKSVAHRKTRHARRKNNKKGKQGTKGDSRLVEKAVWGEANASAEKENVRKKRNDSCEKNRVETQDETAKARGKNRVITLRKKRLKLLLFVFGTSFVAAITFLTLWPKFRFDNFEQRIEVGYQDEFNYENGRVCFGNILHCEDTEVVIDGKVDTEKLGEYRLLYRISHGSKVTERETIVRVVDNVAPTLLLTEFEDSDGKVGDGSDSEVHKISICPNGKIPKIQMKANDNYDGDLSDKIEMVFDGEETVTIRVIDSSGNRTERQVRGVVEDLIAPSIMLVGEESKTIVLGSPYDDAGATAVDNCDDDLSITSEGDVDVEVAGVYEIKYKVKDYSDNESEIVRAVRVVDPNNGNRVVYLTFDDGPSEHTGRLLDILAKYGVKATFFVTGRGDDALIRREYDEGHTVALHTNSHDYSYVYANVGNYFADLYAIRDRVQRITGYTPTLIRFPGGSSNTVSALYDGGVRIMSYLTTEVGRRGFSYADWNVSSGDAGGATTSDQVFNNVIYRLGEGRSVVLQHDTKGFSIDAVERIIQYGQANGYTFLPMTATSFLAHHGVNN